MRTRTAGSVVGAALGSCGLAWCLLAASGPVGLPAHARDASQAGSQPGRTGDADAPPPGAGLLTDDGGLVDQDGRPFSFAALRGRTVVLHFIFTHCASVCPAQTGILRRVQRDLPASLRDRVAFVSVSVDPERDTPAAMKGFAAGLGSDTAGWSFVTGPASVIDALAERFGTAVEARGDGQLDHRAAVHLIDAGGRLAQTYSGPSPDAERLVREIAAADRLFAGRR